MKLTRFLPVLVLCALSCRPTNLVSSYDPAIRGTIFTAATGQGESAVSPVEQNKTNEDLPRYGTRHEFGNSGVTVGFQYVGRAQVDNDSIVDVYLVSLKIGGNAEEHVPVVYSGGEKVVVDRPEVKISFSGGVAPPRGTIRTTTKASK
jgi:hypothetical protein